MKERKQNTTSYSMCFMMVLSSDHITPAPGLTPTVVISKNGGSFASPAGAITEIGNGWYQLAGNVTDRNTLGEFLIHATATGADPVDDRYQIVSYDPFDGVRLGLSALPNAAADAAGGLPISNVGGLDLDTFLSRLDAAISTRLAATGYTAPDNVSIISSYNILNNVTFGNSALKALIDTIDTIVDAIKIITDQINFTGAFINAQIKGQDNIDFGVLQKASLNAATPQDSSGVITLLNRVTAAVALASELALVKIKTDNLPVDPADESLLEAAIAAKASQTSVDTMSAIVTEILKLTGNRVAKSGDVITIYESDGVTIWRQYNLASGGRVQV